MKAVKNGPYYQLRLAHGEEIQATLGAFVKARRLRSGMVVGLGAAENVELGYFDFKKRVYTRRVFRGDYELASVTGNIAWDGKNPICHLHAVITGPKFRAFGGHLFSGIVGATVELSILPGARKLARRPDSLTGLKLLDLGRARR